MSAIQPWKSGTTCPEPEYAAFARELNQASHHFADDSGKEWGAANDCVKRAAKIAIDAAWPYWAMKRMHREIAPLPTFDSFMEVYCRQLCAIACVNALAGLNPDAVADVVAAAEALVQNRDENCHEREEYKQGGKYGDYWSPAAGMVNSEHVAALRTALARIRGEG